MVKRLFRGSEKDSIFGGVCAGLGKYFNIDPVIIRLGWIIISLASFGFGVLAYLIAWVIIPRK